MQRTGEATAVRRGPLGIYYGWWMSGAGAIIVMMGSIQQSISSVFFLPLQNELKVSRTAMSFVFSLAQLEGGIEGPVVGWMIDKLGPRVPIIIGAVWASAGLIVLSTVDSYLGFLVVYTGMIVLGFHMGFIQCMHAAANIWFVRYRTIAMSIFSSAFRVGWSIFTPLMAIIVAAIAWRQSALLAGIVVVAVTLPLSIFIRRSPESMGLLPDGAAPGQATGEHRGRGGRATAAPADFGFKETLRTPSFWIIAFSTTVRLSTQGALGVHFIPIFVWKGMDPTTAAYLVGLVAAVAVPMILAVGFLGDRFNKKIILAAGQIAVAIGLIALALGNTTWTRFLFVFLFAFGGNVSPVNYSILGEYYGRKVFARLRGALNSIGVIGMVTPVFAGYVFDRTQSYTIAIVTFAGMAVAACVLLLFMRPPHKVEASTGEASQSA